MQIGMRSFSVRPSHHDCSAAVASLNNVFIHNYAYRKNQTHISYPYSSWPSFSIRCSAAMVPVEEKQEQRFDVDKAALLVKELRNSYNSRKTQSYEWRMSQIQSIANMIEEKEKDIIEAIHKDLSKPPLETFISEISLTKNSCKLALKELKYWMKPEKAKTPLTTYPSSAEIVSEPLGVVLVISTWNYPFMLSLDPVIGAIAAGNAVVLKPSEIAPATSSLLAKLLEDYVDNSAVRVIEGAVAETSALLEQKWDKIFFTGGARVGRIVMAAAAKHLTPVILELGGKSPAVVDSKINLQVTARRIIAGKWMCTNGQACIGVDYVITTKDFAPKLIDTLRKELDEFFGKYPMESKDLSRIVNPFHFTRLASLLDEDGVSDKIVIGGQRDENQLKIAPTILLDVPEDSMVMNEEIFGPLLPIVTVEKIEDSVNVIKSRSKPLAAYVFSDDKQLKEDFVQNISAGAIVVNDTIIHTTVSSLPFGGVVEPSARQKLIEEGKNLKDGLVTLEEDLLNLTDELQQEAQCIPNMTHPDVPLGGEDSSTIRKMVGSPSEFNFPVKDHVQLGKALDIFDFDAAAEVSGSKFYYLKNEAVMLEMGLINWTLSEVIKRGFTPVTTPEIVRSSVVEKCGFQPRGANTQVYSIDGTDQCLIGTAEIPVGGIHMDSILSESLLPLKYAAFSHCFRTEAGAAGTATRGLYRVHQFSKVEMFVLCRPEESDSYHEELIRIEEELYSSLGLHFKTLDMATEDLGAPAYRKFDVEAWMPGLGRYGEISSASNCTDYQSRRLGIRYRPSQPSSTNSKKGKGPTQFVHTLNATACAIPRMIICILENYQQEDGSVIIPEPLRPFMGGIERIAPKSS